MRLSELHGKEVIDYKKGERLGVLGAADVLVDEATGKVEAFLLPTQSWMPFRKKQNEMTVYWHHIKTIGDDFLIIDM
ncbi:YlmC/YmxH family sporulation protein [Thalassorhabdus alkalitolerans]|uniref:YlmC/YmxH family sporulation protein n=1 Tax=Thalassorhabdus alkalitolerans TaxID=2282697 RepID=A0ABW0YPS3_9BACI|nr:YlmC/YmxH family sporulation protein [Bacillus sp. FJAT-44742]